MASYFSSLPKTTYNNLTLRNLLYRPKVVEDILSLSPTLYHPYVISEGLSIEQVSYYYYDSVEYTWLIMVVNNIIDPYLDWYMTSRQFNDYIVSKYGSVSEADAQIEFYRDQYDNQYSKDSIVVGGTSQNPTYTFRSTTNPIAIFDKQAAQNSESNLIKGASELIFTPVSSYELEYELNDKRKHIMLLDRSLIDQVDKELGNLYNG